ncbi:hypothetical protein GIB67_034145 [Kingdonia uniflora]|uniref:Uncharacterized protein n=1 Tax=Kingdonia uniflora TaxID=39325 RepID=A0A7J7P5D3_9MAGN|nr:hypothetical protein GIB67_034145 [Kingdonia uniflora]
MVIGFMKNVTAKLGSLELKLIPFTHSCFPIRWLLIFFTDKDGKGIEDSVYELANLKGAALGTVWIQLTFGYPNSPLAADDVVKASIYFRSDNSKYVSGHNFMIDGRVTTTNGAYGLFKYNN